MNEEEQRVLEELKAEHDIEEMVRFNNLNVQEGLQDNTFFQVKYEELTIMERSKLEELQDKVDALIGKRYNYYRFNHDESLTKPEIEKYYLPRDKSIIAGKKLLRLQKIRVDFFDTCAKGFGKRQWCMSTFSQNARSNI